MSIPLVKLGYLIVRTLSKPISKIVQKQAVDHPSFRKACIHFSESYHRMEVKLRSRLHDKKNTQDSPLVEEIKPLSDEKAIQFGASFIGEFVIFSIAGIVLLLDSFRSSQLEKKRRAERDEKIANLITSVENLNASMFILEKKILQLESKN